MKGGTGGYSSAVSEVGCAGGVGGRGLKPPNSSHSPEQQFAQGPKARRSERESPYIKVSIVTNDTGVRHGTTRIRC